MKIVIDAVCPPIPTRKFDWRATIDGREEEARLYGYGETPKAALEELIEHHDEEEEWPR